MTRPHPICAVMALLLLPAWSWGADGQGPPPAGQAPADQVFGDIQARTNGDPVLLCQPERDSQWDARFGWWAMSHSGSPAKVGEYQDLNSSPFWDVDGFSSDGTKTLGVTATGTDQETTVGKLYYYQPGLSAKVDYDRFPHQLDHDPLSNIAPTSDSQASPSTTNPKFIEQDLGAGQDYAVRVQEVKASFKGVISDNLKVRLDVWGMEKDGIRQVNGVGMCYSQTATLPPDHPPINTFTGSRCHVLSQPQQIDWTTSEVKPVIEARLTDSITLEYSRPMRTFTSADSTTTRFYNGVGKLNYNASTNPDPYAYAVVPDSYTQMDQLKLSGLISEENKVYAYLMVGSTVNEEIGMNRWFNDMDMRWTNTSLENVSLTTYGTIYNEDEQNPNINALEELNPETPPSTLSQAIREPIDYHKSTVGMRGTWRPWGGGYAQGGLAIVGGYEYCDLDRLDAIYNLATSTQPNVPAGSVLDQSHTITNSFQIGPTYRWSAKFDTYLNYKFQDAQQPLVGLNGSNTLGVASGVFDTLLPVYDHVVEVGFNWFPCDCFMCNACIGFERGDNHTQYANFDEENYPMSFNTWYAVSNRWSLSVGYAVYSNFIGQDITVADQLSYTGPGTAAPPITSRWNYGGQAHVVTFGSRYALTERVTLTGDVEWTRGHDLVYNSAISGVPLTPALGSYSEVLNETTRIRVGADWKVRPRMVVYGRYELYNFDNVAPGYQSGLAQGILGGFSALF